jgi:hypothetical protein
MGPIYHSNRYSHQRIPNDLQHVAKVGVIPGVRRRPVTIGERPDLHALGDDPNLVMQA